MANRADEIKKVKEMIKDKKVLLLGGLMAVSPLATNGQSLPTAEAQHAPITQTSGEYENAVNEIKEAAPLVCRDGFKNFKSLLLEENISGGASVITAREDVKSYQNMIYPQKQTSERYKASRNDLNITSTKQISDAQYHMITEGDGYYHIPNAQNKQAASKTRIKYDNVVKKLNNQQQITSKTISWMQAQKLSR